MSDALGKCPVHAAGVAFAHGLRLGFGTFTRRRQVNLQTDVETIITGIGKISDRVLHTRWRGGLEGLQRVSCYDPRRDGSAQILAV